MWRLLSGLAEDRLEEVMNVLPRMRQADDLQQPAGELLQLRSNNAIRPCCSRAASRCSSWAMATT